MDTGAKDIRVSSEVAERIVLVFYSWCAVLLFFCFSSALQAAVAGVVY
jgi:hypothetical protein